MDVMDFLLLGESEDGEITHDTYGKTGTQWGYLHISRL